MRVEPRWLDVGVIVEHNADIVAQSNEPHLVRDNFALESACHRPQMLWLYGEEDDIVALAVALMVGISQNHPFFQGNKRTGFLSGLRLMRLNGFTIDPGADRGLGRALEMVVEHKREELWLSDILRLFVQPLDP